MTEPRTIRRVAIQVERHEYEPHKEGFTVLKDTIVEILVSEEIEAEADNALQALGIVLGRAEEIPLALKAAEVGLSDNPGVEKSPLSCSKKDAPAPEGLRAKVGDRFYVDKGDRFFVDGSTEHFTLMEVTSLRCGDVWNCHPTDGRSMPIVLTDDLAYAKVLSYKRDHA